MITLLLFIGLMLLLIWVGVLTYYLRKTVNHYNMMTRGVNKKTLEEVLTALARGMHDSKKDIANLIARCDTIEKNDQFHIQKLSLLRFNPFKDTGGDQSFILTLVDARDTGVIITALYSRTGMRWYAKKVVQGKGFEHDLSEEEKKALKMAKGVE